MVPLKESLCREQQQSIEGSRTYRMVPLKGSLFKEQQQSIEGSRTPVSKILIGESSCSARPAGSKHAEGVGGSLV